MGAARNSEQNVPTTTPNIMANVNERIRMNFGMEYGMTIESEKGAGTKVSIVIPAVKFSEPQAKELLRESRQADSAEDGKGECV